MSDPLWGVMVQERDAEIARLRAEVERLTQERDALAARLAEAEGLLREAMPRLGACTDHDTRREWRRPVADFLASGAQDNGKDGTR